MVAEDSLGPKGHVFRFFVSEVGRAGLVIELSDDDSHHGRVLHGAASGTQIEVVCSDGQVWSAAFEGLTGSVRLLEPLSSKLEPRIELLAFVSVGGKVDELVEGATQAGATKVTPVVHNPRDLPRITARVERLRRVARSAAKQSKRANVPIVDAPLLVEQVLALGSGTGIIVDLDAQQRLDVMVASTWIDAGLPLRLLVGGPSGFPAGVVAQLAAQGWGRARLGHTVMRSELAAAVAVAIAALNAPTIDDR